jgi:parallel beta-helix repeat protein
MVFMCFGLVLVFAHLSTQFDFTMCTSISGIDYDAYSFSGISFRNYIHDNGYQGVFLEQGSKYHAVVGNTVGPRNNVGLSFYNNVFSSPCTNHFILGNHFTSNFGRGLNVGSLVTPSGAPSSNSFIVGNMLINNSGVGWTSNGPVLHMVMSGNDDRDGIADALFTNSANGGVLFVDPLRRERRVSTSSIGLPTASASGTLNATLAYGVLTLSNALGSWSVAPLASAVQQIITQYFGALQPAAAETNVWPWATVNSSVQSFLTLTGPIVMDVPLKLPPQLVLVLHGALLTPAPSFVGEALLVVAQAPFAAVVSPAGPRGARISCSNRTSADGPSVGVQTGLGMAAIVVRDSPKFVLDGVSIDSCGSKTVAAVVLAASAYNASASPLTVDVSNCYVSSSAGDAVSVTNSSGTILRDNVFVGNAGNGVSLYDSAVFSMLLRNTFSANAASAVLLQGTTAERAQSVRTKKNSLSDNSANTNTNYVVDCMFCMYTVYVVFFVRHFVVCRGGIKQHLWQSSWHHSGSAAIFTNQHQSHYCW